MAIQTVPSGFRLHGAIVDAMNRTDLSSVDRFRVRLRDGQQLSFCNPASSVIGRTVYWSGLRTYERDTSNVFEALLDRIETCIDVGANIGYYTLLGARRNPNAHVYAFEPAPETYRQLVRNVQANRLENVTSVQAAVGDEAGTAQLFLSDNDCSASIRPGFRHSEESVTVPLVTLDQFVEQRGIERVDLIKIDVEGAEDKAIRGSERVIERDRPMIICEVLAGRTEQALQPLLDAHDYHYALITEKGLIPRESIQGDSTYANMNYLFSSRPYSEIENTILSQVRILR